MDNAGDTPLHEAVRGQRNGVVSLLLNQGSVQLDIKNKKKMTPLLEAVSRGHLGMTHLLIALGANINAVDGEGNSCLHLAMETEVFNSEDAPMDLLNECCTALNLKKDEMLSGVVAAKYLASQGADFHHRNNKYNTPFDLIKDPNLRKKLETFSPPQCLLCRNKEATTKVHPCEHLLTCEECSKVPLKRCLRCLKPVTSRGRVEARKFEDRCVQTEATCQELEVASQETENRTFKDKETQTQEEPVVHPKVEDNASQTEAQPLDILTLEVKHLHRVSKKLAGKWQQLGRELEITQDDLEIIKHDNPYNIMEQGFQMLLKWFRGCDPAKRTPQTLKEALLETECFTALECLLSDFS
ncbi:E3 ubiquitin-protein ligase MIB1-like [Octopus sinensis]|uniref:E3 ubiquitin-protein ligase MIB1-like n=1 Tax=Octopus sinensis TaxID=2607531 RepID=A0A6P7U138_9MOLL|nr:E3 ubiquitin-protein ligase MIB1-like [Octopus sinensis]